MYQITHMKNVYSIRGLNHWNRLYTQYTAEAMTGFSGDFVLTEISLTPRGYEMGGYYK